MITLSKLTAKDANFRHATALMIEARVRGYPLLGNSPEPIEEAGGFNDYINDIIRWLLEQFPNEFQLKGDGEH